MRAWALYLIRHRMVWLLKALVWMTFPLHLLAYWDEALGDIRQTNRAIDFEVKKLRGDV